MHDSLCLLKLMQFRYLLWVLLDYLLSGTMIRGTLTKGLNRPQNAKHELSNQAHEGLQSPSDPKERKGLKEAHFALSIRPGPTVQPIRTPLELAEQSPLRSRLPRRSPR